MILGISAFYHDAAASLIDDRGNIVAAAQEERFSRRKHDPAFPRRAIDYCLAEAGIGLHQIELVAFYEKPWIKFERLLETYLAFAPAGIHSFLRAMPVWLKQKMWIGRYIERELGYDGRIIYPEHHESHAASAFYPSPFPRAAILTIDGVGEWATAAWGVGTGRELELRRELHFPHSLGLLYSAFTYYTGFRVNSGEYKVMGLAPYGQPRYVQLILEELMDLRPDGSFRLNMKYFNYCQGLTMTSEAFHELFGGPPRRPESALTQRDMDLARSVQEVTEEVMLRMARHVRRATGERNLCLAGGVALNAVGNGRILRERVFDRLWIQPAAGDAGGAIGAALFAYHQVLGSTRVADGETDGQQGSYLGPAFSANAIDEWLIDEAIPHRRMGGDEVAPAVAELLAGSKVVGWFSGRMEFGPRALGARSILADPRNPETQRTLNLKIKYRESFRPFAPSCLREETPEYFDLQDKSPYMLMVAPVREEHRLPTDKCEAHGLDRLNLPLSSVPAVTHVDYSARVQTVDGTHNVRFHELIRAFHERTGCPLVVNTSFNRRDEPIVCNPADAYTCFMQTEMDALVLEDYLLLKEEQPTYNATAREPTLAQDRWVRNSHGVPTRRPSESLRRFGLVMAAAFGLLSAVLFWRDRPAGNYVLLIAAFFALSGVLFPGVLAPVRRGWMAFADRLSRVTNFVLLVIVFILVITPAALLMRVFNRDRLELRSSSRDSYWVASGSPGAAERYDRPY